MITPFLDFFKSKGFEIKYHVVHGDPVRGESVEFAITLCRPENDREWERRKRAHEGRFVRN